MTGALDLERFGKVAGLLASPVAGERAAAADRATDILCRAGMTWADLLAALRPAAPASGPIRASARPRQPWYGTGRVDAAMCAMGPAGLNDWEIGFCGTVATRGCVSARERQILDGIIAKRERARERKAA